MVCGESTARDIRITFEYHQAHLSHLVRSHHEAKHGKRVANSRNMFEYVGLLLVMAQVKMESLFALA